MSTMAQYTKATAKKDSKYLNELAASNCAFAIISGTPKVKAKEVLFNKSIKLFIKLGTATLIA